MGYTVFVRLPCDTVFNFCECCCAARNSGGRNFVGFHERRRNRAEMTVTTNFSMMRPCFTGYPFQGKMFINSFP